MTQKEFTNYAIPKILEFLPQFMEYCVIKPNDIVDIEYLSESRSVQLWVTTQDIEITIGFNGFKNQHDWHIHLSTYDGDYDNEIDDAISMLNDIISDRKLLLCSKINGYSLADEDNVKDAQENQEEIELKYWSEL